MKKFDSWSLVLPLLLVLFVGLKLGGIIQWSWWLVLLPAYVPVVVVLLMFFVILLVLHVTEK